ncbi:MAG: translation elongation factor-like protein [Candidatus Marinimicrobia bacterium]|jgi:putative protease|nr:translation elongation factor-like protein [Candidatus Neomarinimicrobiota bacterium]
MKLEEVPMSEKEIGFVSHFFGKISVAGIEITGGPLSVGDKVHIDGHTTDLVMDIKSLQVEHETVSEVKKGDSIGLKVSERVRPHDKVYLVVPD